MSEGMTDAEVTRILLLCGAVEAAAWGAAWFMNWSVVTLVAAIAVSTAVAGVIVVVQRKRRR